MSAFELVALKRVVGPKWEDVENYVMKSFILLFTNYYCGHPTKREGPG